MPCVQLPGFMFEAGALVRSARDRDRLRSVKLLSLAGGVALFALLLADTDIPAMRGLLAGVGWGFLCVCTIYAVAFLLDTVTWHLTLDPLPLTIRLLYPLWKIRMVGEAFNDILPLGSFGGEPVKAVLAMRTFGLGGHAVAASLVLARTVNTLALVLFLAVGFGLVLQVDTLPSATKWLAGVGLLLLLVGVAGLFAVQRYRLTTIVSARLFGRSLAGRLQRALGHIREVDGRLVHFYRQKLPQFHSALFFALLNWALGAAEVYLIMRLLDYPIGYMDAWIVEAVAQMVRAGAFFVPAAIGIQEGAFVFILGLLIGRPDVGLAAALVRRLRQIFWIAWGLAIFVGLRGRPKEVV